MQPTSSTSQGAAQEVSNRKLRSRERKREFKRLFPQGKHAAARNAQQLPPSPAPAAAAPSSSSTTLPPAPSQAPAASSQVQPSLEQQPIPPQAGNAHMSERSAKRAPPSPRLRDSPARPQAKRPDVCVGGPPSLAALLPPSLESTPRANPATVNDFINVALSTAELEALRENVRAMAQQVASLTCSDLHVIMGALLEQERRTEMLDAERVPTLVQLQRRMAFLEAYQREVLEGPGSEFPDMYPGNGEGGRASSRGVRAGRKHGKAPAAAGQSGR